MEGIELIAKHFFFIVEAVEVLINEFDVFIIHVAEHVGEFIGVAEVFSLDSLKSIFIEVVVRTDGI